MKYKQMNAESVQDKKSSDTIMQMKKHLLFKGDPISFPIFWYFG